MKQAREMGKAGQMGQTGQPGQAGGVDGESARALRQGPACGVAASHDAVRADASREVLVVDDDRNIREMLGDLLRVEGYHVQLAENGQHALEIIRRGPLPAVVLLDMMMPVMSGWEFLELAEDDELLRKLPVVVVSALSCPIAPLDAEGGVRGCVCKPIDVDRLLELVDEITADAARIPL